MFFLSAWLAWRVSPAGKLPLLLYLQHWPRVGKKKREVEVTSSFLGMADYQQRPEGTDAEGEQVLCVLTWRLTSADASL